MDKSKLQRTAQALVVPGKGILAADESFPTIKKRFESIGLESTEENRRAYREILFATQGIEKFISGVILFDETVYQKTENGRLFPQVLAEKGIIPGIKVDEGKEPFEGSAKEMITKGIEDLPKRLSEYQKQGMKFTKWRAVFTISEGLPTKKLIEKNAQLLSRFAVLSQEAGLVPIVEPEVLMDGEHDIDRCEEVTKTVLANVFSEIEKQNVSLEGLLLKPNMVVSGKNNIKNATPAQLAEATLRTLTKTVPERIPGIVFLSGGQSPEEATTNLNAINSKGGYPWELSFSFGRALQKPSLLAWKGKPENVTMAQEAFYKRAKLNSLARYDKYKPEMENS